MDLRPTYKQRLESYKKNRRTEEKLIDISVEDYLESYNVTWRDFARKHGIRTVGKSKEDVFADIEYYLTGTNEKLEK